VATTLSIRLGQPLTVEGVVTFDGAVADLTGGSVLFMLLDDEESAESTAILSATATVSSPTTGAWSAELTGAQTAALTEGTTYRFRVNLKDSAGDRYQVAGGEAYAVRASALALPA
jgi:hypothetical protein